jgi:phosphatidylethanolamine/phosphatidyl-N-methylethanolamine N-methyltransferase
MALFDTHDPSDGDEIFGSDAATRALSVTAVDNHLVSRVYENLAWAYDYTFGPALHPGRVDAIQRMGIRSGDRVLEVGVGTRLLEMDASNLKFADDSFDIVYAPYVISVVPDPVAVAREMHRVCRPGGRIVILNHFRSKSRVGAWLERAIAPFTLYLGFKSDLDLPAFLVQADLQPVSIEKVNIPRIWSLVTCVKREK